MRNNVEVLAEDAKRYAELHLAMQRGWDIYFSKRDGSFEVYTSSCYGDLIVPVGLSDEDKLACTLINLFSSDMGLTTKRLIDYFRWSKYKCYKLARANRYCYTTTLVCEEGGYGGTGWVLLPDMHSAMFNYIKQEYPCKECKHCVVTGKNRLGYVDGRAIGYCYANSQYTICDDSGCRNGHFERKEVSDD